MLLASVSLLPSNCLNVHSVTPCQDISSAASVGFDSRKCLTDLKQRVLVSVSQNQRARLFFVEPPFALTLNNDTRRNPSREEAEITVSPPTAAENRPAPDGAI